MSSYIGKFIGLFTILYTLLIPSTIMNASAEGNVTREQTNVSSIDNVGISVKELSKKFLTSNTNKKDDIQNADKISEHELPDFITRNIQTVGNILSSSSSKLAEQAKSYALGKFNSTVASEAQKWLSQFGTAKINFGLDRKGKLENNSLDLLLPLYDNKADWLLFSQLGYRNKDSRNTVNLGLGGRYFYQNWMYGLNTFYDYDLTGKNRRVGFGGEIWGDYIKLSANAYRRLSDWQISRYFEEHHERPANGYDINGEFFLPVYPNLGGKLVYEQYFGENVTLFNRDTKQKNPRQVKLGVTYTPIPLITMGVDYKQGEGGRTETQFLANINYRLGVPLSTQLSPDNVAAMRALAGSRYDLVERNNNIVLDHRKIPIAEFFVPGVNPNGYKIKDSLLDVTPKGKVLTADGTSKYIYTAIIVDRNGNIVKNREISNVIWSKNKDVDGLNLRGIPKKGEGQMTNSEGKLTAELIMTGGKEEKDIVVSLSIEGQPAVHADKVSFEKTNVFFKSLPQSSMTINKSYELTVAAKNDDDKPEIKKEVTWASEPQGIIFSDTNTTTNDKGEATTKFTSKVAKEFKIIVTVKDIGKIEHPVKFEAPVDFEIASVEVYGTTDEKGIFHQGIPSKPLIADNKSAYLYRAKIVNKNGKTPIPNHAFSGAKWSRNHPNITDELGKPEKDPEKKNKTDKDGYLYATLKSHNVGVDGIRITLTIPSELSGHASQIKEAGPVSFESYDQDAILFVYNKFNQQKQKHFTEKGHPFTVFDSLIGRLGKDSSGAFDDNKVKYNVVLGENNLFGGIVSVDGDKNVINFSGPVGTATIYAKIVETYGRNYSYKYPVNIIRYIHYDKNFPHYYRNDDKSADCIYLNKPGMEGLDTFISLSVLDFIKSSGEHAINSEFDNLYDWGLFHQSPDDINDDLRYKLLDSSRKSYVIFDPHTEKSSNEPDAEGLLLCTIQTTFNRDSK
ncbi:inverse autotransporter-like protein with beta domain [Xenorhabdus cabanillasii]|uniref:Inverse autotransporter-like protein with beta domain n=1 Tax=Xenorhabdus cabanillasii TaxID=351673 RepID=A0A3D9UFS6_9GAMM|nr:inverse autotransporter beta domain-containing protein [Xenorhabdus cabanillasii]REF26800.1 inverse autotransporter-like protein with beta domain [Xenorhabdus cabanillasii]